MSTKERSILFSGPEVQAILEDRKTQARIILKTQPHFEAELRSIIPRPNAIGSCAHFAHVDDRGIHSHSLTLYCPYGMPGDRIWVGKDEPGCCWMAAGCSLEITGVRVERLQEISEADARAEGIEDGGCLTCGESEPCGCSDPQPDARDAFAWLWQSIHGHDSWDANPWVWVVEFKRVEQES